MEHAGLLANEPRCGLFDERVAPLVEVGRSRAPDERLTFDGEAFGAIVIVSDRAPARWCSPSQARQSCAHLRGRARESRQKDARLSNIPSSIQAIGGCVGATDARIRGKCARSAGFLRSSQGWPGSIRGMIGAFPVDGCWHSRDECGHPAACVLASVGRVGPSHAIRSSSRGIVATMR